ncbi:MAG: hypothetical protein WAT88_09935, partial [Saprospiraceae bacterium]
GMVRSISLIGGLVSPFVSPEEVEEALGADESSTTKMDLIFFNMKLKWKLFNIQDTKIQIILR